MNKLVLVSLLSVFLMLSACMGMGTGQEIGSAYWQHVDSESALYMKGPKAQQMLEENIATCVREIDELIKLVALRETTPPDTHSEYHRALKASGDLDYYDTPTRLGNKKVAHSDFHDFESCMRYKGWERVRYLRYQEGLKAKGVYKKIQHYRKTGKMVNPEAIELQNKKNRRYEYFNINE